MREIWVELGATMRKLRTAAGMSLRQAELASGFGRGTLSQVETGKARPSRAVVEWYDVAVGGDGMLQAIYAEAQGAHGMRGPSGRPARGEPLPGDRAIVIDTVLPYGALVTPGGTVTAGWTLRNAGPALWQGRRLSRVGPHAGVRLLTGAVSTPVPDCGPGDTVSVEVLVAVPDEAASYAAYWQLTDAAGRRCLPSDPLFSVVVVAAG